MAKGQNWVVRDGDEKDLKERLSRIVIGFDKKNQPVTAGMLKADKAMFDAVKANIRKDIPVVEMDNNINDAEFAAKAVEMMLDLIKQAKTKKRR